VYVIPLAVKAEDGLTLIGEYYLIDVARPTVLLLHQLYTDRASWQPVIPYLLAGGYNALAVDERGAGATGGLVNWDKAVSDVQVWIDLLRAHNAGAIVTMGSSMGSSLALIGCGHDPGCAGAIAISPGWDYYGLVVYDTFVTDLAQRPALIVYAQGDPWPSRGVPLMVEVATGPVQAQGYLGNAHGMDLFTTEDTLIPLILDWLRLNVG
jgi:pimeloyl-ACP methyl ester carboxylesterase